MLERAFAFVVVVLLLLAAAGCGSTKNDCPSGNCATAQTPATGGTGGTGGTGTSGGTTGGGTSGGTTDPGTGGVGPIAPSGALPNGAHISIDCIVDGGGFNVPAFTNDDCLYSHWGGEDFGTKGTVDCTMKLADAHGLVIGTPTRASFMSEAGAISPSVTTVAYDPKKSPPDKMVGHAVAYLEVFGSPLPADVPPVPGEPSLVHDYGCGVRTANPRDGYVTVIGWVEGEEGYVDVNLNGKYDPGEPFVDMGEPYVDANDNGVHDPDEWFLDTNGDGVYTGPNGVWDAKTIIWTQTRVLYSGFPAFLRDPSGNELLSRFYNAGSPPAPTPEPPQLRGAVNPGPATPPKSLSLAYYLTDDRLNPLSRMATFEQGSLAGNVSVSRTGPDLTANLLGDSFRLLYCDQPNGGTCHDGPAKDGCRTSPCYVVPEVGLCRTANCAGLINGNRGTLSISCDKVGSDRVSFTTTIDSVRNTMWFRHGEAGVVCEQGLAPTPTPTPTP